MVPTTNEENNMQPLQLLSTLRAIANNSLIACQRQEFKPEFIYSNHNAQVSNIEQAISGYNMGAKVNAKYKAEIKKIMLSPMKDKNYYLISEEIKQGVNKLSSAIDFMKR
ncbi:hypothetical protein MVUOKPPV_CDS0298 [Klebsiella phage phi1_175008]|uniref:Uncharacterized protein n=2 Tax=Klebsiella phage phi1_175008 TaxID=3127744 RepID=A0ACD5FRL2_9CAUD